MRPPATTDGHYTALTTPDSQHRQQLLVEFLHIHVDDPPHRITEANLANHSDQQGMDEGRCAR